MLFNIIFCLVNIYITYIQKGIKLFAGLFNVTCITHSIQTFIIIICILILKLTGFYPRKIIKKYYRGIKDILKKRKEYVKIINKMLELFSIIEYALIVTFVITGAILLLSSGDLGSMYLCIELQSFSLYIISAIHRNSESSTGSALMYFLLGGLSSCFILLGIALIYANAGIINTDSIYCLVSSSEIHLDKLVWYNNRYIFYSLLFISVGFLFKIAAAPFHWWSPDVYDGVPTIVTTFIAILGKISILIILMELVEYTTVFLWKVQTYSWITSLSLSCFFSLLIGTILGVAQTRIKKLLAYSTISHIGFILLALIVHNTESYQAFLFYIFQYILTNLSAFLILIAIGFSLYLFFSNISEINNLPEKNNSPIQLISQLNGYFSINPFLATSLAITMLSFLGLPPLSGFFGKQMVLTVALDNKKMFLVIFAILTSVISAVYYLTIIKVLYFDKTHYDKFFIYNKLSISSYLSIIISILTLAILFFILLPVEPINLCNILSLIYYA